MTTSILVMGDSYLSADQMRRTLDGWGAGFRLRYEDIDGSVRPTLPGLAEYQGDPMAIAAAMDDETVLLVHAAPVTAELLDARPQIRLIACARGNPINVDLAAARERGVAVINTPAKNADSVADLTLSGVNQLMRRQNEASSWLRERALAGETHLDSTFSGGMWMGREPRSAVLGLIGVGAIGRKVSALATAFGMSVQGYDPYVTSVPPGIAMVDLDELISTSDVVSLHAKATAENRHLVDTGRIARMKRGAILVNTARESLLDESALLDALWSGQLGGAVLDVCEPDGVWPQLVQLPNVILTPHIGGATEQVQERGLRMLMQDIESFASGGVLQRRVA
ncbi:NAD(P)-dependent oxidoreductase [Naasia sp. SYSU D00057]|uniref:NAD(P)-dependent oxidoreductase n=1 Tax=Naasia sp. SYSU D00057 TaxID=2817380 RepID=UPI001B3154E4|nr:NAD(P)-dependent oxidoreductase [Naasia sp. SYSU D00057]